MDTLRQMNLAMRYIESRLENEIDFSELSKIACCSEYHFKRVFSYLAGMPISEYIRLRKLACAALLLTNSDEKIIDIAMRFGYKSPDAFTKAFKSAYNYTPAQVRKGRIILRAFLPMSFQIRIYGGNAMDYRIETKGEFKIAGIRKKVTLVYEGVNPQMLSMWGSLTPEDFAELEKLSNVEPHGIIAASANFSEGRQEGSEHDQYFGVATTMPIPAKWETLPVPSSTWAVFTSVGDFPKALQDTWARIYSEWFMTSDYEVAPGPEIARIENTDTSESVYKSEIWIPITKK